ncbi:hypothetical protein NIES2119_04890 [[Phormidium ambiguum] IAM M-71]|uniref:Sigma-70 family RNA polymerase sigma factor n=1 Tax=[Phormidium ambiguum] IAM M-71 TaxID=454136 RepID=A0A1U7IQI6_9CYAN|nr:hypothetical protein [Phormidium ambiguum]OKH39615.1 hypothetical protein NIES2119_04890 [Phormidium ambiguum IAM M-71]
MDERLMQLVTEVQQHAPQTEEWQFALTRLVDEMLRSRTICRHLPNQPLFGIYQVIYEQIRQQLLQQVGELINQYKLQPKTVRKWANGLRSQAIKSILDDAHLKQLALTAQHYSFHSELRQYALGELVEAIRLSGRLCHPHREEFTPRFYELLYDEAVNETLSYICQKIDKYDPERGDKKFMNWVNFRLDRALLEAALKFKETNFEKLPSLSELESIMQPEALLYLENLREYIEEDAENIFQRTHIRNRPDANFKKIALARFSEQSWQRISESYDISIPTLSSFFQRSCEKFRPKLMQYF